MYIGHDSTIVSALTGFNVWDKQVPGYNMMLMIELHEDSDQNWTVEVRMINICYKAIEICNQSKNIICYFADVYEKLDDFASSSFDYAPVRILVSFGKVQRITQAHDPDH